MNKNTAMYLWTSVNRPQKLGLWRWPHLHATDAPSIPSLNAAVRVACQPTSSSTNLKFWCGFPGWHFFSEYWLYNVVIYSVAFYTEMWYFSKELSDSVGVITEPVVSWATPRAHIVPNRSKCVSVWEEHIWVGSPQLLAPCVKISLITLMDMLE